MPGVRRSPLAIAATGRALEQRIRIGGEIRTMRERRDWTRTELAARAGIGRMVESRVERGASNLDLDVLQRIGIALDRPLLVTFGRRHRWSNRRTPATWRCRSSSSDSVALPAMPPDFELPTRPAEPWRSVDVGLISESERRDDPRRVLEHLRRRRCGSTVHEPEARRSRRPRRRPMGLRCTRRRRLGRPVHSPEPCAASAISRGIRRPVPGIVTRLDRRADRRPASPGESGLVWCDVGATRVFEWRRHATSTGTS